MCIDNIYNNFDIIIYSHLLRPYCIVFLSISIQINSLEAILHLSDDDLCTPIISVRKQIVTVESKCASFDLNF